MLGYSILSVLPALVTVAMAVQTASKSKVTYPFETVCKKMYASPKEYPNLSVMLDEKNLLIRWEEGMGNGNWLHFWFDTVLDIQGFQVVRFGGGGDEFMELPADEFRREFGAINPFADLVGALMKDFGRPLQKSSCDRLFRYIEDTPPENYSQGEQVRLIATPNDGFWVFLGYRSTNFESKLDSCNDAVDEQVTAFIVDGLEWVFELAGAPPDETPPVGIYQSDEHSNSVSTIEFYENLLLMSSTVKLAASTIMVPDFGGTDFTTQLDNCGDPDIHGESCKHLAFTSRRSDARSRHLRVVSRLGRHQVLFPRQLVRLLQSQRSLTRVVCMMVAVEQPRKFWCSFKNLDILLCISHLVVAFFITRIHHTRWLRRMESPG
ncbi:hypothetical protein FOZ61_004722 [Perkinsus olseni]|uniref:Uncharacterized protein n=1 Tax=Perkinsus olseni TaxID=32597 RepID=A0A7J6LJI8_PEROL|nr:hypothetical protein FOZ61_004722 [Perkinsus olseni]